jgi:hypothetical protein
MVTMTWPAPGARPVGELLREWRERRRISQLDLAIPAAGRRLRPGRTRNTGWASRSCGASALPCARVLAGHEPYPAVLVD